MIGARFVILTLLVFLAGGWARRFGRVPLGAYFAAGLVTVTLEMMVLAVMGVRWNVFVLLAVPVAGLLGYWFAKSRSLSNPATQEPSNQKPYLAIALLALIVFASAVLSASVTSGDFVFFWGSKAQRFGSERMLDTQFLRVPEHNVMHPDYPPLVPLYYAWTMLGAAELDWFGAMASAILFLALATAAVSGFTRDHRFSALFASMFALLCMRNSVAGNAEPALLFFEAVALGALLARNDGVAAIALAGAALTKIEGSVFVILAIALLGRRWRVALVPLVTLAAWLLFAKTHGLLDSYVPREELSMRYLLPSIGQLARELSFGLWYAPWIALALLVFLGNARRALPYAAAALAFLGFMAVIYARPEAHMEWSAQRVLMTPLVFSLFGAIAAQNGRAVTQSRGLAALPRDRETA